MKKPEIQLSKKYTGVKKFDGSVFSAEKIKKSEENTQMGRSNHC
jgi:hypothetical protein